MKTIARLLVLALLATLAQVVLPNSANASEEFDCTGGKYSIDESGVVSGLSDCSGELILDPKARSFEPYIRAENLTSLTFPALFSGTLENSVSFTFPKIVSYKVNSANTEIASSGDAVYTKDLKTLLLYPAGKTGTFIASDSVHTVAAGAFNRTQLTRLDLSANVETLQKDFLYGGEVKELNLSAELKELTEVASLPASLEKISVDAANQHLKTVEGYLVSKDGKRLIYAPPAQKTSVCVVPDQIEILEIYSFSYAECENVNLPVSLKKISGWTFFLSFIKKLRIPENVEVIEDGMHNGMNSLEEISVDPKNSKFKSTDGVLFDASISRLISYPMAKSATAFTLPKTVTSPLWEMGTPRNLVNFVVEAGSASYKAIDGVIFDIEGQTLYGYPRGREDSHYILPTSTKKIVDGSIVKALLVITTEDPTQIDTTSSGVTVYDSRTGLILLEESLNSRISDLKHKLMESRNELSDTLELRRSETETLTKDIEKLRVALNSIESANIYRTSLCNGGSIRVNFEGALIQATGCKGSLTIPSHVESLNPYSLYWSPEITELIIGRNLKTISPDLFSDLSSLNEIKVDSNNPYFESVNGVLFNKEKSILIHYPRSRAGKTYTVPETIKKISSGAFAYSNLTQIILPSAIEVLESGAFYRSKLQSLNVPKSFSGSLSSALSGLLDLISVNVEAGSRDYLTLDGVVYGADGQQLVMYPAGKSALEFTIPEGVKSLGSFSFQDSKVKNLALPKTIEDLGYAAFDRSAIEAINVPAGVSKLTAMSFYGASSLKSISIEEANDFFVIKNGVLFSKDMSRLIYYPKFLSVDKFTIPNSVKVIDYEAFYGSSLLELTFTSSFEELGLPGLYESKIEVINFPESQLVIPDAYFNSSSELKEVNMASGNPNFSSIDGILFNKDKSQLILIPPKSAIKEYIVPETVKKLSRNALGYYSNLVKIKFGLNVESIPGSALSYSPKLQSIEIDNANLNYAVKNGALYDKQFITLIALPYDNQATQMILPETLTGLDSNAILAGAKIETLTIPSNLDSFESWQFSSLLNLKTVIYDGKDPRISEALFTATTPRILSSAELKAEEERTAALAKLNSDLKKLETASSVSALNASAAEAEMKLAKEAQAKAESDARLAKEAQAKAESDARLAKEAQAKAESDAQNARDGRTAAEAALNALTAKVTSTITCIKGRTKKKVTGILPSCPKGYKKK